MCQMICFALGFKKCYAIVSEKKCLEHSTSPFPLTYPTLGSPAVEKERKAKGGELVGNIYNANDLMWSSAQIYQV